MTDTSAGIGLQKGRVSLTNALNNEGLMNNTFQEKTLLTATSWFPNVSCPEYWAHTGDVFIGWMNA